MSDLEDVRHQLILLTKSSRTRSQGWPKGLPSDWRPQQVRDPGSGDYFTENGAWQFITELLQAGEELEEVILDNPEGKKGYVMKVDVGCDRPLYIKLQLGSGAVIGRSFHPSEPE